MPSKVIPAALLALLALATGPARAEDAMDRAACLAARPSGGLGIALPGLGARPALTLVAFGSSSTSGIGGGAVPYPAILEAELTRLRPTAAVRVVNRGRGGDGIGPMLDRLEADVLGEAPDLVIWQVGTNDVLREDGVGPLEAPLRRGLDAFRARGVPVVLMDVQDAPRTNADPDLGPMNAMLASLADGRGVGLFRRNALMRALAARGTPGLVEDDGLHLRAAAQACVAMALAADIDTALGGPRPLAARR